ncbi:hypothetical protein D4R20_01335 [bacterium]|nr:MAG: hypothetical protein D4R20_01335 [bacterium]
MYVIYKIFSYGTKILFLWTFIEFILAIFSDTKWKTVGVFFLVSLVCFFIVNYLYQFFEGDKDLF